MSDNMKLWKMVETTDPSHTKKAVVSGQKRTSINPIWQKEKATEVFGVQGIGWGVVTGSESFERIHLQDGEIILQYTAAMFFHFEGDRGEVPIAAAIKEASIAKRGTEQQYLRVDHEAIKKVRTDAVTKGLSELGFNADVFKGYYDSQGYSEYASEITSEERAENAEKEAIKQAEEYAEWKKKELAVYSSFNTVKAVTVAHTGHVRKASKIGDAKGVKQFTEAKDKRIAELKEADNA